MYVELNGKSRLTFCAESGCLQFWIDLVADVYWRETICWYANRWLRMRTDFM